MNTAHPTRIQKIIHHWLFWLFIITFIGILIRMLPSLVNPAWGVDFGIYYGLTNSFVTTRDFINSYTGWGGSYQYFPVLYTLTGIAHLISGIETVSLMPKIAPIFGGLTVPLIYLIANEIIKNKRVALLSAAFLSVATFHVYQTSHAAPMTIGHFFMMISIYLLVKSLSNQRYFIPLILSTFFLIFSHHFTTYFYIISVTFIIYANIFNVHAKERNNKIALLYLMGATSSAFLYWGFVATPVFYNFMPNKMFLDPFYLVGIFCFSVPTIYFLLTKVKKIMKHRSGITIKPAKHHYKKIITYLILLISASIIAAFYGIPGMTVKLTPLAVLFTIPMLLLVSFSFVGLSLIKNIHYGIVINGWVIGILISFTYSLINPSFLPDRHLEYLIVPLCISAAFAVKEIYNEVYTTHKQNTEKPILNSTIINQFNSLKYNKNRVMILSIISLMFIANMMATYPSVEVLNIMDERVTDPCINGIDWMKGNLSNGVVASDHRLSNLIWANGYNITFSETNMTWTATNYSNCKEELDALNISYIIIDDIMRENVVFIGNGISFYMTNESYDKFSEEPFTLLYRNASYIDEETENHWIEIYQYNRKNTTKSDIT